MNHLSTLGSNLLGITTGAVNGTLGIANTGINKSTSLVDSALGSTLDSVRIVNESAQKIVQQTAETTSKISTEALKTTGTVSTAALGIVGVNTANAASILNTTSTEGTQVTNEAVQQSGRLAKTTLSLAGNALYNLIGTADNLALSRSQTIKATSEMTTAMYGETLVTKLNNKIKGMFRSRMNELIVSLDDYSKNQSDFIKQSLVIYQTMHCDKGRIWGHNCLPDVDTIVRNFKRKLEIAGKRSKTLILQLKGINKEIDASLMKVYGKETTLDNYKIEALRKIEPFYERSAGYYIKIVDVFTDLTKELDTKLNEGLREMNDVKQEELQVKGGKRTRRRLNRRRRTKKR